jgi:hypothetical protein
MAFFEEITSSAGELFNSGVEYVGDAVSSVTDSFTSAFAVVEDGNISQSFDKNKKLFQYPLSLGASAQGFNYESNPADKGAGHHAVSASNSGFFVSAPSADPFISFTFKEINVSVQQVATWSTDSGVNQLSSSAIQATAAVMIAQNAIKSGLVTNTKSWKAFLAANAITFFKGAASLTAGISAIDSFIQAKEAMAKNLNLEKNPNRITRSHVALYMIPSISIQDSAEYESNSRIAIAMAQNTAAGDKGDGSFQEDANVSAMARLGLGMMGGGVITGALGMFGVTPGAAGGMAAAGEILHLFGDEGMRTLGRALNPNEYKQFKSVGLRSFSFSFKFLPESKKESDEVTQIIKEFRTALYPTKRSAVTLAVPDIVDIKFHGVDGLVNMPEVGLKGVNITYNPNSASFFSNGGTPVEITMAVDVEEIHPIYRDDVTGIEGL